MVQVVLLLPEQILVRLDGWMPGGAAQAVGWGLREGLFDGLAGIVVGDNRSDCRESRHGLAK